MAYGFDIDVGGDVLIQMKKIEASIADLAGKVDTGTQQIKKDFEEMGNSAKELGMYLAGAFAIEKIKEFGTEILHLTAEFEGFENVIKYSSKDSLDAGINLEYIDKVVTRLHLPIVEATQAFSEMQAGFYGTGIEGERLRKVFEGVATASSVLHLSPFKFSSVTFAMKEIGELGTLQARQLRMLAFSLPGAVNIAAKAMHMSTAQLHEGMKHGQINSADFLPKFAAAMQEHFSPGLGNAGNSLISQMNDTQTALVRLKLEIGQNLRPLFVEMMKDIRAAFNSEPIKWFVANIKPIAQVMLQLAKIWVLFKIGVIGAELAMAGWAAILKIVEVAEYSATFGLEGFQVALGMTKTALITSGIGAFAVALGLVVAQLIKVNQQLDDAIDRVTHFKDVAQGLKDIREEQGKLDVRFSGLNKLDASEKSELYTNIQTTMKDAQKRLAEDIGPGLDDARRRRAGYKEKSQFTEELDKKIENLTLQMKIANEAVNRDKGYLAQLKAAGVKPESYTSQTTEGSLNTSHLAGASGGLGEAKIIQIHFHDAFQKNVITQGAGWDKASRQAIETMLRMLNNIGLSQSTTQ